ncbi:aldehyde dehydrogenase family protein [Alteribacillus sp. JSM 102045]|uniref:aldehyde dehydrogenase family protein n=1 Tax=Alteribacillus sp. JSM 102045 TaxID=1562101 RepID=UPI0035C16DB7
MKHAWINGSWETGSGKKRTIENPATWETLAELYDSSSEQVDRAVKAAEAAFMKTEWPRNPLFRKEVLQKASVLLQERAEEFAELETLNTGKPLRESFIDIEDAAACLHYYAGLIPDALTQKNK